MLRVARLLVLAAVILSGCSAASGDSAELQKDTSVGVVSLPATKAGGECETLLGRRLQELVTGYNSGNASGVVGLFSEREFAWYTDSDRRIGKSSEDRHSLEGYLRERHREGDRFIGLAVSSEEYESERDLVHLSGRLERPSGTYPFKGAMRCDDGLFVVWSIGAPTAGASDAE